MLGGLAPLPASADEDLEARVSELEEAQEESWKFKWDDGFKLDSPDGEFKLKFGGRIQADWTFITHQDTSFQDEFQFEDGNEFRRARLFFEGTVYGNILFKAQYDFAGGLSQLKDVYVGFKGKHGRVLIGHQKEQFSLGELTSSKYIAFAERALVSAFSPGRNVGVAFDGSSDHLTYGFGVYRETNDFGRSLGDDVRNVTGRFVFRPIYEDSGKRLLHVGISATDKDTFGISDEFRLRSRAEFHFGPDRPVDTGTFATDGQQSLDLELAGSFGRFWFSGEYMQSEVIQVLDAVQLPLPAPQPETVPLDFDGLYLQAGFYLTGEHRRYQTSGAVWDRQKPEENFGKGGLGAWEIAIRYSELDLSDEGIDGGVQEGITLGVNWYLNPATRFLLNYILTERSPGLPIIGPGQEPISGAVDAVVFRAQIDF